MERKLLADLESKFITGTRQGLYQRQAESAAVWNLYSGRLLPGPGDETHYPQSKGDTVAAFLGHVAALVDPTVGGPTAFVTVAADAALPGDAVAADVPAAVAQIRAILPAAAAAPAGAPAGSLTQLIGAAVAGAPDSAAINSRVARLNTLLDALIATFPVPNAAGAAALTPEQDAMVLFIKNAGAAGFHAARIASGAVAGGRRRRNRSNSQKNKRKSQKNKRSNRKSRRNRTH